MTIGLTNGIISVKEYSSPTAITTTKTLLTTKAEIGCMLIKVHLRTPPGRAQETEKKLRMILIGVSKPKQTYVRDNNSELVWIFEDIPKKIIKVQKNIIYYKEIINTVLNNKVFRKTMLSQLSEQDQQTFVDMITEGTQIDLVKISEEDKLEHSWWKKNTGILKG